MAEIVDFGLQQHKIKMDSRYFENVLSVVAGDTGRRLEVQLLDTNGMVQDTTGLNLRLNALVAGKATFTDATLVDAATGKYKLDLSNGMFLAPGNWQFQWQITDSAGKKLHSFAFTGNVGKNISEGGSQATNFYLNLEDLKKMQDDLINGTIDSSILETNIAEKLTDLETQYAPRLTEVTAQLAQNTTDFLNLGKEKEGGTFESDNYSLLLSLIDKAKSEDKGLYVPNGKYYCSEDLVISGIKNIVIDGTIVMGTGKVLEITYSSTNPISCDWKINTVDGKLRLSGIKNANVKIIRATTVELFADGDLPSKSSIAYSQVHLGLTEEVIFDSVGTKGGWINENAFYGGRIKKLTMKGNYPHNNNTFYKPMMEGCEVVILSGGNNTLHDVRFEGTNTVHFGEGTYDNVIEKSYIGVSGAFLSNPFESNNDQGTTSVVDLGIGNQVVYSLDKVYHSKKIFEMNCDSNNFDLTTIKRNTHSLTPKKYGKIFESGLIRITEDIGVHALSDKSLFRFYIHLYDSNKQLLKETDVSESYGGGGLTYNPTLGYLYGGTANSRSLALVIFKNSKIKYISIDVILTTFEEDFEYLQVAIKAPKRVVMNVPIPNKYNSYISTNAPTEGDWKSGERVLNSTPTVGLPKAWVCTIGGSPGTWVSEGVL